MTTITFEHIRAPHRLRPLPRPAAHIIRSDAEALEVAASFAAAIAPGAAERDRDRRLPHAEVDAFSQSGLWALTVPRSHGGPQVRHTTLVEVFRRIAQADPSIAQIPQNHYSVVTALLLDGSDAQQRFFFAEVLQGARLGNAVSETGTRSVRESKTRLLPDDDAQAGGFRIEGRKFYSTGALFADWIPVSARDAQERPWLAILERGTPGLEVIDDWSGFGQRTTASGSVTLAQVPVQTWQLVPSTRFGRPTLAGPFSQILQAAIDAGIAHAALEDLRAFVTTRARPWIDSGADRAAADPLTVADVGRLRLQLRAADALLDNAARALDETPAVSTPEIAGRASLAVAEAKILTTEIALQASSKLFEFAGSQSTLAEHGLDRHWRNARVHTLHDPVRWKYHALGDHFLNGTLPPHHLWF
ncbi:MAG TPA: SfnB family sulfur acquisition oxidoreductase [Burkholderiaceae bacterium]